MWRQLTKWQRILIIVLIGLFILAYAESIFSVRLEHNGIDKHQSYGNYQQEHQTFLGSFLVANFAALVRFLHGNDKAVVAGFTVLLVIVTGILAYYTGGLWNATVEIQRDSRATSRLELRAYIGFREHVIRLLPQGIFQIQMLFENSGKTTAKGVCMFLNYTVQNSGYQGPFTIGTLTGKMPLAPLGQRSFRAVIDRELSVDDIPRIAMDREIFVWGRIEYRDIYDVPQNVDFRFNTRERIAESAITGPGGIQNRIIGWALQPTEDGNDAS